MTHRIAYTKPSITPLEIAYASDAAANGWGERCYEYITRFENAFAAHLGVRHAIATSSCTGALHLGLAALSIGMGDEVILADTNWIATAAPVVHLDATPVFVDVLRDSWCIDASRVEAAVTRRTRAIIVTHLYGNLCDMHELLAIGRKYDIPIIEDSAEAIGAVYHGQRAGSMGRFGVFSFHGTKTITTGEGGMFVTDDALLHERVLTLSNHGRTRSEARQFWPEVTGFKYKMSNLQAAMGCAQLERVDELVTRKREILQTYRNKLSNFHTIALNPQPANTLGGAWMPTAVFDSSLGITTEMLRNAFACANIDARVFFHPLTSLPMFGGAAQNAVAHDISRRAINLPSFHDITAAEIGRVVSVIARLMSTIRAAA